MSARAEANTTRALVSLYCPDGTRALLQALVGIEREIAAVCSARLEHSVAHARLNFWRAECERTIGGTPQHPLTRSLLEAVAHDAGLLKGLTGLPENAAWDLARAEFPTAQPLRDYCDRWAGGFIAPLAHQLAPHSEWQAAVRFGSSLRALELLLCVRTEAAAGRIRVPLDALQARGITADELHEARWGPALCELIRAEHESGQRALAFELAALTGAGQAALRPLLVWAALLHEHSRRALADLPRAAPAEEHQGALDGWRAWRAARRAAAGQFRLQMKGERA